jgi:hypothetical protein
LAVLKMGRFKRADYVFNTWAVNAEAGVGIEDILKPQYWAHVAAQLTAFDEIVVRADDGAFRLHLFVETCGRTWAKVHLVTEPLILQAKETPEIPVADGEYAIKWAGPHDRWRIIRTADKEIISKGHATRDAAETAVKEYLKVIQPRFKAAE